MSGTERPEQEEWRAIPGTSGDYLVSNLGRVKSLGRTIMRSNGWPQTFKERILRLACDEWGYPMARVDGITFKVHRAVALAFLGPRPSDMEVRHLDGNSKNNVVSNLSYGTHSENILDGYSYAGRIRKGQKLTTEDARVIKTKMSDGVKSVDLAREYGISQQSVCDIKHGRIYRGITEGGAL